jgi:hypothetical protein
VLAGLTSLVIATGCVSPMGPAASRVIRALSYEASPDHETPCEVHGCPIRDAEAFVVDAGGRLRRLGTTDVRGELALQPCRNILEHGRLFLLCKSAFACGVIDMSQLGEKWCSYREVDAVPMARLRVWPEALTHRRPLSAGGIRVVVVAEGWPTPLADCRVAIIPSGGGIEGQGRTDANGVVEVDETAWSDGAAVAILIYGCEGFSDSAILVPDYNALTGKSVVIPLASFHTSLS